jgi:hypothetical protein
MDDLTGVDKRALDRIEELEATQKRLREERLAFAEESEMRLEENKQLREALTEIWQLDAPGQCAEIANAALEGEHVEL